MCLVHQKHIGMMKLGKTQLYMFIYANQDQQYITLKIRDQNHIRIEIYIKIKFCTLKYHR